MKFFCAVCLILLSFSMFAEELQNQQEEQTTQSEAPKNFFFSKNDIRTKLFSLDLSYLFNGISNNGWGLGLKYEQYFAHHLAGQLHFGHSTFVVNKQFCPTVTFGLFLEYYPFREGLDGFYIALGGLFDFVALRLISEIPKDKRETYLSVYPFVGWKIKILKWLSADLTCGYKKVFINEAEESFDDIKVFVNSGVKLTASIKIHFF